jgi:2-dehydro-3-deoxygalactonokinase
MIAIDWGTSSLRGARLDDTGAVLEERTSADGLLKVPPGQFATVLEAFCVDWARPEGSLTLISGMAGSKQGWVEAPYCPCPAGFDEVARQLKWIEPGRVAIVPGLCCEHAHAPDVMRGEETQIFGALQLTGLRDGLFVLPGTHSKWAQVQAGRVASFKTFMTGEVFALLSQQSILSKTIDTVAALDRQAFLKGVDQAALGGSLLHNAFGARTLSLLGRRSAAELASFLSGLVIGEELRANPLHKGLTKADEVVLIGADALTLRYALAFEHLGVPSRALGSESTWAGLFALSQTLTGN